ncbi:hypothetical protein ACQEU3_37145 [Spirillospora sp. CA-253888]
MARRIRLNGARKPFRAPFRRGLLPAIAALAVACGGLTAAAHRGDDPAPAPRAMWLWHQAAPARVVTWATAQGVDEIFAYVSGSPTGAELARLRELKRRCDRARIRLAALGGEPEWAFDHAAALNWQRTALRTGLFAATHVDVEPYALPEWKTDRPRTVAAYTDLLAAMANADRRPLEADVPFWYETVRTANGATLADAVLTHADAVTVMSYRDTATGPGSILAVGTDMLERGARAGRPVRLAAETAPLPDCPACTFREEGRRALEAALARVDAAAAGRPSYRGIAVHDHRSWTALRP